MFSDFIKESKEFGSKEDNPLVYTLVIAKLAKLGCKDATKQDEKLFNLINKVEKILPKIDAKKLRDTYSPIGMFGFFENAKSGDLKQYVEQYYQEFESAVANDEKTFAEAFKIHQIFSDLKNSDEYKEFIKSL
jgi:hypothetical protein